ncbi:DUF2510 domain-containing protein [Demequina aurantiaca]|uniref:DUF2510 domain-containing protein n=1 Tax=Demequina aurantiaca TaxID=676200 RepID=UPI003D336466
MCITKIAVMTNAPEPGWYDDPQDIASSRYWDGVEWAEHTKPRDRPVVSAEPVGRAAAGWEGWRTLVAVAMGLALIGFIGWMVYSAQHAGDTTQSKIDCILEGRESDC